MVRAARLNAMNRRFAGWLAFGILVITPSIKGAAEESTITHDELVRREQELFDAVGSGNAAPWQKYFAADCLFFDEKGRNLDKPALIADIAPLPKGFSGEIKVLHPESRIFRDTAILSYDLDETETVFGQAMTARYHGTDTWYRRNGVWQIVASQMFRYYEDPAPGKVDGSKLPQYVGTYQLSPDDIVKIATEDGKLYRTRGDGPRIELICESGDLFFRKGVEGRILFRRDNDDKIDALIDRRNNEDLVWRKVD
jgi:Domain of unknown function (DUF4440)